MEKYDYEKEMTELIMIYKKRVDNKTITFEEVNALLGVLMAEVKKNQEAWKMLEYAWENNGDSIELKEVVQ